MKELQILLEILPTEALTRILRVTCNTSFLVKEHSVLAAWGSHEKMLKRNMLMRQKSTSNLCSADLLHFQPQNIWVSNNKPILKFLSSVPMVTQSLLCFLQRKISRQNFDHRFVVLQKVSTAFCAKLKLWQIFCTELQEWPINQLALYETCS